MAAREPQTTDASASVTPGSGGSRGLYPNFGRRHRGAAEALEQHLLECFGTRRLDAITPDDLAELVRELRNEGIAESTIVIVIGVVNRIYRYAARRLGWVGSNPVSLMLSSERPKASQGQRRRIFQGSELEQTISAADEPYRTLFTVAALTGARLSELLGLTWDRVRVDELDDAEVEFAFQVDWKGSLTATKTDGSARTVPIPKQLAEHKQRSSYVAATDFVFCTPTGRPFGQRNIARALGAAQFKATTPDGQPTFPALHVLDEDGESVPPPHGEIPSMPSFRHTVASGAHRRRKR